MPEGAKPSIWSRRWLWVLIVLSLPVPPLTVYLAMPRPNYEYQAALEQWAITNAGYKPPAPYSPPEARTPEAVSDARVLYDTNLRGLLSVADAPLLLPLIDEVRGLKSLGSRQKAIALQAIAIGAMGQGDWDEALTNARELACMESSEKIYWFYRRYEYRGSGIALFEQMMRRTPDAGHCRQIARAIGEVRRCAPPQGEEELLRQILYLGSKGTLHDNGSERARLQDYWDLCREVQTAAETAAIYWESIEDSGDRQWARRNAERYLHARYQYIDFTGETLVWTQPLALRGKLQALAGRNPKLLELLHLPGEVTQRFPERERATTDLATLQGLLYYMARIRREWRSDTKALALQVAWAARAYHLENGAWPEDISDLDPELLAPAPDWEGMKNPDPYKSGEPAGALSLKWIDGSEGVYKALPGVHISTYHESGRVTEWEWDGTHLAARERFLERTNGAIDLRSHSAMRVPYAAQSLAANPLVTSVQLNVSGLWGGDHRQSTQSVTPEQWQALVARARGEEPQAGIALPEEPIRYAEFVWTANFPSRLLTVQFELPEPVLSGLDSNRVWNQSRRSYVVAGWEFDDPPAAGE